MLTCGTACKKVNINKSKVESRMDMWGKRRGGDVCLTCASPFFFVMMDLDHKHKK